MKLKKLLAAVTAAALAVTTMAVASFTASAADDPIFEVVDGVKWSNADFTGVGDLTAVKKAKINLTYTKLNGTYSNGQFFTNSAESSEGAKDGWKNSPSFAPEDTSAHEIELEFTNVTEWFQVGYNEYGGGSLTVNSITLLDEDGTELSTFTPTANNKILNKSFSKEFTDAPANANKAVIAMHYTKHNDERYDNGQISIQGTGMAAPSTYRFKATGNTNNEDVTNTLGNTSTEVELDFSSSDGKYTFEASEYGNGLLVIDSITFKTGSSGTETPGEGGEGEGPEGPSEGGDDPIVTPPTGSGLKTWTELNYGSNAYELNLKDNNVAPENVKKIELVLSGMSSYGGKIDVASSSTSNEWNDNSFLFNYEPNPQTISIEFGVTEKAVWENGADTMMANTLGFTSSEEYAILKFFPSYMNAAEPITLVSVTLKDASGNVLLAIPEVGGSGSGGGVENPPVDPAPENPAPTTPSTPSAPSTSTNPAPVSQTTVIDKILATPDSGKSTVDLGSSTKVDKLTIEAIATKGDVTIKLNVAGGAYWEINGQNVTDAKDVNLGVKVNSKQIPESKVEAFAGEKKTVQLTLSHNGDLGFTGTLNVPVGSSNNGKFANLYYYHGGKFDFVGSSPISGGRTQFAFSHASNYLIVIDDYAYGEDVSSAAAMTETTAAETEANAVPYVAVLVVIAAFGASALVLKKRLSK